MLGLAHSAVHTTGLERGGEGGNGGPRTNDTETW